MIKNNLIKLLIIITVFIFPLYLLKVSFFRIPTNWLEILALATIVLSLFFDRKLITDIPKIYYIFSGAIMAGLFLSSWNSGDWKISLGMIKGWFLVPMAFALVVSKYRSTVNFREKIIYSYFLSASLVSLTSLIYAMLGLFTYDHRLKGFFLSPNHLAMFLAPSVIVGIYFLSIKLTKSHERQNVSTGFLNYYFLIFLFSLILSAFYLTYSYAAWISIIASLFASLFICSGLLANRKAIYLVIISFLLLTTQLQSPKLINQFSERSSWQSRIMIWRSGLKIASDNPILGIGPGNFQNKYLEYQEYFPPYLEWAVPQPHNLYLAFWLESGIVGLLGFMIIIIHWLSKIISGSLKKKPEFEILLFTIIIYVLLHGLIDTPIWKNDLAFFFWIIIALGIKKSHQNGK